MLAAHSPEGATELLIAVCVISILPVKWSILIRLSILNTDILNLSHV